MTAEANQSVAVAASAAYLAAAFEAAFLDLNFVRRRQLAVPPKHSFSGHFNGKLNHRDGN